MSVGLYYKQDISLRTDLTVVGLVLLLLLLVLGGLAWMSYIDVESMILCSNRLIDV